MKPEWLIFDVGGVILDWHSCRQALIDHLHLDFDTFNPVFSRHLIPMELGQITPHEGFKRILDDLSIHQDIDKIFSIWINGLRPIAPTIDLIPELKKHYRLGICTNNWTGVLDLNKAMFPVLNNFEVFIDSSSVHIRKPDLDIYRIVEKAIGTAGQNILFIDDTPENIEAATRLNWQTALFNSKTDGGLNSAQLLTQKLLSPLQVVSK